MRGWIAAALVLLSTGALVAQQPAVTVPKTAPAPTPWPTGNTKPGAADIATMNEVIAFEKKMETAVVRGDVKTLEPMLADDFIFTHGDGWFTGGAPLKTDTKASWAIPLSAADDRRPAVNEPSVRLVRARVPKT